LEDQFHKASIIDTDDGVTTNHGSKRVVVQDESCSSTNTTSLDASSTSKRLKPIPSLPIKALETPPVEKKMSKVGAKDIQISDFDAEFTFNGSIDPNSRSNHNFPVLDEDLSELL
jgi:hypothetical protein